MWQTSIDQFVTIENSISPSILPLVVKIPGVVTSCHIGVYFPTAGFDDTFVAALADLESTLMLILDKYGEDTLIFLRVDMNASIKNSFRYPLLSNLINKYQYTRHEHRQTPTIFYLKLWTFALLFFSLDMEFLGLLVCLWTFKWVGGPLVGDFGVLFFIVESTKNLKFGI